MLQPALVAPLQVLRVWAFTFLSIGRTTRFRGAFSGPAGGIGQQDRAGFVLSTQVFADFWARLGQ